MISTILGLLKVQSFTVFDGVLTIPDHPELTGAIQALPWDDEFLSVDLDTISGFSAEHVDVLKAFQCGLIREKRELAYKDEADSLFFAAQADGDSQDTWSAKREEIKARYPWPGAYR